MKRVNGHKDTDNALTKLVGEDEGFRQGGIADKFIRFGSLLFRTPH